MKGSDNIKTRVGLILVLSILALFLAMSVWVVFFPDRKDYETLVRSSSLKQIITEDGDVTEITYVNEEGNPTVAANVGYATVRRTKRQDSVFEEYLDENGERIQRSSGNYALLREYDDQQRECKVTWLDQDEKPCLNSSGYAILIRSFDAEGRTDTEWFYDVDEVPVETRYYAYGRRYAYDEKDHSCLITYLDQDGKIMMSGQGFAAIRQFFYVEEELDGRVENDAFLDVDGKPCPAANGTAGRKFTYDEVGRTKTLTCLDQQGIPFMNKDGFATIEYTYYEDDGVKTEMYFDPEGKPVALAPGYYGVLHEEDKVTYLNEDGSKQFSFRNLLLNQPVIPMIAAIIAVAASLMFGRKMNCILLVFCLGAIAFMTLLYRKAGESRAQMELFYYYRQFFSSYAMRKEIIDNLWLFVPLGTIIYRIFPKRWIWVVPLGLSLMIEAAQYVTGLGSAEIDDVISNGLGGAIGVMVAVLVCECRRRRIKE